MAKVRMLVHTGFNGKPLTPGMIETVDELTAQRWERNKIATIISTEAKKETVVIIDNSKKVEEPEADDQTSDEGENEESETPAAGGENVSMDLTKAELINIAVEKGLDVNDRMTKAEIIAEINKAESSENDDEANDEAADE